MKRLLFSFQSMNVNLKHIESRPSRRDAKYEFMVECEPNTGDLKAALNQLKNKTSYLQVISRRHDEKGIWQIIFTNNVVLGKSVYSNCPPFIFLFFLFTVEIRLRGTLNLLVTSPI